METGQPAAWSPDAGPAAYFPPAPPSPAPTQPLWAVAVAPTAAPRGSHRAVAQRPPDLPWQLLVPFEEIRRAGSWLRGWPGLFAAAAIAPFVLLRVVAHDADLHRAAIGFAVYFALVWAVAIHAIVKPQRLPVALIAKVGLFTVVGGVAIALGLEKHLGAGTGSLVRSVATVGFPEEVAKATPLVLFMLLGRRAYSVRTYIFVGALSGLLFGAAEAVSYSSVYEQVLLIVGDSPTAVTAEVWRLLTDGLFHACMTGLSAFFIGLAWHVRQRRVELVVAGVVVAAIMHGTYDALANGWGGTCVAAAIVLMFLGYIRSADRVSEQLAPGSVDDAHAASPVALVGRSASVTRSGAAVVALVALVGSAAAYVDARDRHATQSQQAHAEHVAEVGAGLRGAAVSEEVYRTEHGVYATDADQLGLTGFAPQAAVTLAVVSADAINGYCLTATYAGDTGTTAYYDSRDPGVTSTPCE